MASMKALFLFPLLFLAACAHEPSDGGEQTAPAPALTYSQLALKDLDQMALLVKEKINDSRTSQVDKVGPLKEGLFLVYARPDDDGMIDKVEPPLRAEIEDIDSWEHVLTALVDESTQVLKNPEGHKASAQVTHAVFLNNVIGDLKPRARRMEGFERELLVKIRDAQIELSRELKNERKVRMMKETPSPSEMAGQVLNLEKR